MLWEGVVIIQRTRAFSYALLCCSVYCVIVCIHHVQALICTLFVPVYADNIYPFHFIPKSYLFCISISLACFISCQKAPETCFILLCRWQIIILCICGRRFPFLVSSPEACIHNTFLLLYISNEFVRLHLHNSIINQLNK